MARRSLLLLGASLLAACGSAWSAPPVRFEVNRGQAPCELLHVARLGGAWIAGLEGGEIVLTRSAPQRSVRLRLAGAGAPARIVEGAVLRGVANYCLGRDPSGWLTGVESVGSVRYDGVLPGVDVLFRGERGALEFDVLLAPGADASHLRLELDGADASWIDEGEIVARVGGDELRLRVPAVYQHRGGARELLACAVGDRGDGTFGFDVHGRDARLPLVIDPVISLSSYLGGADEDRANEHVLDASGHLVIVGATQSLDFPTAAASQPSPAGGMDAFVTKLDPTGTMLVWSTYLGGTGYDEAFAVARETPGTVVVGGQTGSADFPALAPFQATLAGGTDAFLVRLDANGVPMKSTYFGGSDDDLIVGIESDALRSVHVAGDTRSSDLPLMNAFQSALGGETDVFVAAWDPALATLQHCSYHGGSGEDDVEGFGLDAAGSELVVGRTRSTDMPTVAALQPTAGGIQDALLFKTAPDGASLVYSTYFGGSGSDHGWGGMVDSAGNLVFCGMTNSTNLPTLAPLQTDNAGGIDGMLGRVDPAGVLLNATYLGGSSTELLEELAQAPDGSIQVAGRTASDDFPLVQPYQTIIRVDADPVFIKIDPTWTSIVHSTFFGSRGQMGLGEMTMASPECVWVSGQVWRDGVPMLHAFQPTMGNTPDASINDGWFARICDMNCRDGLDEDGDALIDCADPDCAGDPNCILEDCGNGVDDDWDGTIDCASPECVGRPPCIPEICTNGADDDGDTLVDCLDTDCIGTPPCTPEDCDNGADDDGDTLADCLDTECVGTPPCTPENCTNGQDDDGDTLADCLDADCVGMPPCTPEDCDNGADDDGDTLADCLDADCVGTPPCTPEDCDNGTDDDGDTLADCLDTDCVGTPPCTPEDCGNGADDDGDTLIDCFDTDCIGRPPCSAEACTNGIDDDGDTLADCLDADCALHPTCDDDDDDDGVLDVNDCAPDDGTLWRMPDEVTGLRVTHVGFSAYLTWDAATGTGLGAIRYDLAGGAVNEMRTTRSADGPCLETGLVTPDAIDATPTPAGGIYYLARAVNACGPPVAQGWGSDSTGVARPACP